MISFDLYAFIEATLTYLVVLMAIFLLVFTIGMAIICAYKYADRIDKKINK